MRLLTFIGVGHYQPTAYTWRDQEFVSAYAPVATCHFLKPDAVTVFVTEKAQEEIYPAFEASLAPGLNVQRMAVSFARDERGGTAETAASPLGWVLVEMTPVG